MWGKFTHLKSREDVLNKVQKFTTLFDILPFPFFFTLISLSTLFWKAYHKMFKIKVP